MTTIEIAPWPTPQVHDSAGAKTPDKIEEMRASAPKRANGGPPGFSNLNEIVLQTIEIAPWATPASQEAGGQPEAFLARKEAARVNGSTLGISLTSLNLQAQTALPGFASKPPLASKPTTRAS
jgi:hypothetical protein